MTHEGELQTTNLTSSTSQKSSTLESSAEIEYTKIYQDKGDKGEW